MTALPGELWLQILHSGVRTERLQYRDLCAMAIVSRQLKLLCESDLVWKELVEKEFPETSGADKALDVSLPRTGSGRSVSGWKGLYKLRFEKVKRKKVAAHRREVLRATSALHMYQGEAQMLKSVIDCEREKLLLAQRELRTLDRTRRTSVALHIWQPRAVSTRHEQVVQQVPVDIAAQQNNLKMEVQNCNVRIRCMENALNVRRFEIEEKRKELAALNYNPTLRKGSDSVPINAARPLELAEPRPTDSKHVDLTRSTKKRKRTSV